MCFDFQPNNPQEAFVWFTSDDFTIQSGGDTSQLTLCGQVAYSADGAIEIGVRSLDGCNVVFFFKIRHIYNVISYQQLKDRFDFENRTYSN